MLIFGPLWSGQCSSKAFVLNEKRTEIRTDNPRQLIAAAFLLIICQLCGIIVEKEVKKMRKFIALILLAAIILPSFLTGFAGEQEYSIYHDVLHCECQYTAKELAYGLKYELVDDAKDYIAAKEKYGICPIYNAAKDALESGWGRYAIRNNLGGVTTDKAFSSHAEFIDWWSAFQLEHYLLQDGKYHTGGTL